MASKIEQTINTLDEHKRLIAESIHILVLNKAAKHITPVSQSDVLEMAHLLTSAAFEDIISSINQSLKAAYPDFTLNNCNVVPLKSIHLM